MRGGTDCVQIASCVQYGVVPRCEGKVRQGAEVDPTTWTLGHDNDQHTYNYKYLYFILYTPDLGIQATKMGRPFSSFNYTWQVGFSSKPMPANRRASCCYLNRVKQHSVYRHKLRETFSNSAIHTLQIQDESATFTLRLHDNSATQHSPFKYSTDQQLKGQVLNV